MPNQKNIETVKELVEKIKKSKSIIIVDYRGIKVDMDTKLRKSMRDAKVDYIVAKNNLFNIALKECGATDNFDDILSGTSSFVISYDDVVAPAKVVTEFITDLRKSKKEFFTIKGGVLGKKKISSEQVEALAKLPSKEVLVAKLLGSLQSPISGIMNVMQGPVRNLCYVLNAIKDKK